MKFSHDGLTLIKVTNRDIESFLSSYFNHAIGISWFSFFFPRLDSITIPGGPTQIGNHAFHSCTSLRSITIPNSVTHIGSYAFSGCTNLSSIVLPSSVTQIGSYAFHSCTSLSNITIPNSVTHIGILAFSGCTNLSNIVLPSSVTEIASYAFSGCTNLSSIVLPSSVTYIGNNAFADCNALTEIIIDSENDIERMRSLLPEEFKDKVRFETPIERYNRQKELGEESIFPSLLDLCLFKIQKAENKTELIQNLIDIGVSHLANTIK